MMIFYDDIQLTAQICMNLWLGLYTHLPQQLTIDFYGIKTVNTLSLQGPCTCGGADAGLIKDISCPGKGDKDRDPVIGYPMLINM